MTGERLDWLLRALGTTGRQLAETISIDCSTLSKWRKNRRPLRYDSTYAMRIAEWALTCPREREPHVVRDMLIQEGFCVHTAGLPQLQDALRLWLTMPDVPKAPPQPPDASDALETFEVPLETTLGLENMFRLQNRLFDLLNRLPDGQEIVMTDLGAINWAGAVHGALNESVRINREALEGKQHHMVIIDQLTDIYHPKEIMFQWMPVYLQANVRTYFYRAIKPLPLRQNFLLIKGQAALAVSSASAEPDRIISSLYRDPEYVRLFDAMTATLLADSKPMMQVIEPHKLESFLRMIGARMRSAHLLYMINRLPTFRNMPAALLAEILDENEIKGPLFDQCMTCGQMSTTTRTRCESRQIYDLDAIERALTQEYIVDYDLTALVGHPVYLSRAQFARQLRHLGSHAHTAHYSMSVYPFSRLDLTSSPPCNLIVQDDSLAAAWDLEHYARRMYSEEHAIVNGFYQYADSVWEQIPPFCRSAEWSRQKLDTLLEKEGMI